MAPRYPAWAIRRKVMTLGHKRTTTGAGWSKVRQGGVGTDMCGLIGAECSIPLRHPDGDFANGWKCKL